MGRGEHRGFAVGKRPPTGAKGRPGGTEQVSLPSLRDARTTAERQRDGPDDLPLPPLPSPLPGVLCSLEAAPLAQPPHVSRRVGWVSPLLPGRAARSAAGKAPRLLRRRLPVRPSSSESPHRVVQMRPGSFAYHANEQIPSAPLSWREPLLSFCVRPARVLNSQRSSGRGAYLWSAPRV